MKTLLAAVALIVVTASAFADSTPFVTHASSPSLATPQREPSRYAPYSRNTPRLQTVPLAPTRQEASRTGTDHVAPYSRNYPRSNQSNG